jgi:flagellin-specific chaperone FliS
MTVTYTRYEEDQQRWKKKSEVIDVASKLIGGLNRILNDESVPEFDKELLKNYLKEALK